MKISYMEIRGGKIVFCDGTTATTTLSLLINARASKLEYSETKLTITRINEMILKWRAVGDGVKGFLRGELE